MTNQYRIRLNSPQAQDILKALMDGNKRFTSGKASHPHQDMARREEMLEGQKPFVVILTCSDSRVPPEILFDQGIGDLFVVRTAGNVVDNISLGSIEYAVEHLKVPLVIVLGHEKCGAVTAATSAEKAEGHIANIIEKILPAVEEAKKKKKGDLVTNAIEANIRMVVEELRDSEPILAEFVKGKELDVVGATYAIEDGTVTLLKEG